MSSVVKHSMVVPGKLKFKGSKRKDNKINRNETASLSSGGLKTKEMDRENNMELKVSSSESGKGEKRPVLYMTDAQKIHKEKRKVAEEKELKKLLKTTHRDRIEMFNCRLGQMTEHNDIPRISAAGNG